MQVKRNNKISRLIFVISHSLGQQRDILRYARACVQIILWKQGSMRQEKGYFGVSSKKVWVDKIFAVAMKKRSIDNAVLP